MKKIRTLVIVAVVLLSGFCTTGVYAQKIGYVSMQELVTGMPEMKHVQDSLQSMQKELQTQSQVMQQEYTSKLQDYDKGSKTWSDAVKQVKTSELQDLSNRIQSFNQAAQEKMQTTQSALLQPVVEKAQRAVGEIAKEKGLAYVIDNSADILVFKPAGDDITTAAKAKLGVK